MKLKFFNSKKQISPVILVTSLLFLFQFNIGLQISQAQSRKEICVPDIFGYLTLKCDFHIHTVFSDGDVWPTKRVEEAWRQGLDAIAITDHIEYRPHKDDLKADLNRSYEIARPEADKLGLILIRGTEITRKMPPGHLNAIFVTDANPIETDDWFDACREAQKQGAFVFWNHPGWKAQQPEKTLWWKEHTRLLEAGILKGIEVYNYNEFYPEALQWAHEKNLTMLANSDIHSPIDETYEPGIKQRPVTLVFAKERKSEAIKEALENHRTVIYFENQVIGDVKYLDAIFKASVKILANDIKLKNKTTVYVLAKNSSDVDFILKRAGSQPGVNYPQEITLKAQQTTVIGINGNLDEIQNTQTINLQYDVVNMFASPDQKLKISFVLNNN